MDLVVAHTKGSTLPFRRGVITYLLQIVNCGDASGKFASWIFQILIIELIYLMSIAKESVWCVQCCVKNPKVEDKGQMFTTALISCQPWLPVCKAANCAVCGVS